MAAQVAGRRRHLWLAVQWVTLYCCAAVSPCKTTAAADLFLANEQFYTADASVVAPSRLQWLWLLKASLWRAAAKSR